MKVLVTGGASGIGEAITRLLVKEPGNQVWLTYRSSKGVALAIASEYPNARAVHCDFSDPASVDALLVALESWELTAIVNGAIASLTTAHAHKLDAETLRTSFEQNVVSTIRITNRALAGFRSRREGRIVTVLSSYLVNKPPTGLAEYVANKAYLRSFAKSWAIENARFGVTSNCISPSLVRTHLTSTMDERTIDALVEAHPLGRLLTCDEVAEGVRYLLTASPHVNGVNLLVNAGNDVV
jgi:NAD(P)-dependent dehydrogenase (short-subunit alcohol dehydrogenase family)